MMEWEHVSKSLKLKYCSFFLDVSKRRQAKNTMQAYFLKDVCIYHYYICMYKAHTHILGKFVGYKEMLLYIVGQCAREFFHSPKYALYIVKLASVTYNNQSLSLYKSFNISEYAPAGLEFNTGFIANLVQILTIA